jgi:hypothetical protein
MAQSKKSQTAVLVTGIEGGTLSDKKEENVKLVKDKDIPKPGDGELLIRVKYR